MAKDRLSGKLAVILHADVAGSTDLVQQDKQLAHERIQDAFLRFSTTVENYQGHVVELRGDALLAEFERASDAVSAALSFQSDHTYHLSRLNDDLRPTLRVGIAMGEVIVADSTVTGAGVVQAQRVEQLADPGGVCVTAAIHESLSKRMPFDLEDLGEQMLKGFDIPVRVYRVELSASQSTPLPQQDSKNETTQNKSKLFVATIVIALVLAGGAAYWFKTQEPKVEAASIERMAFPLPDKPSIAVLPFTNMSNDTEQEYFVDGLTEDLITDISKVSGLFVIARNSVFTYKGKAVKVRQVAEELGVRYVMEGSVRRVGNQVRITAQLIDATTGGHLWAERYDGSLQDIFLLQDQVTRKIVSALKITLTVEEEAQQAQHSTGNAEAHDAFLQGWAHYKLGARADLARSIPYLEEAVRLDPGYADAHALLATVYWDALKKDWAFDLSMPSFEAEDLANHHLEEALKTPNLLAHAQQSRVYLSMGLPGKAVREAEMAVALDPNSASAYAALADTLILTNRPQEGLDAIRKAIRLDPHHPPQYLTILGAAQFGLEQFEAAVTSFERAVKRNPDSETSLIYLASSYGHLGDLRKADATIETANDLRATNSLGALRLENINKSCSRGEIDFPRFGPKQAQDRLRLGLSKIPALGWQNLIIGSASGASGKTFDSAMGEWSYSSQGTDCYLNRYQLTIVDEIKVTYPERNGRILFYAIDDQRKWEGYWVEEASGNCAEKKDGSTYWGVVTFRFNDTYTQWKGEFDECGEGKKYPWDGFRQ
jgi:TolB-like protein/class 3 adenylate cyclase/Flp pilus assembly protein TadD